MSYQLYKLGEYTEEFVYLNTGSIGLDILLRAERTQIEELISVALAQSKNEQMFTMSQVWSAIKETTKEGTDKICKVEPTWSNLMDDIAIFFVFRLVLLKKPLPIIDPKNVGV